MGGSTKPHQADGLSGRLESNREKGRWSAGLENGNRMALTTKLGLSNGLDSEQIVSGAPNSRRFGFVPVPSRCRFGRLSEGYVRLCRM